MSHIVEDGSGKSDATSYTTDGELTNYAAARNITLTATADDLITRAMDYLESQDFIGSKLTEEQALMWPRYGAVLDGFYVDEDSIPNLLKEAQHEIAIAIDGGVDPLANVPRETTSEKVGEIAVTYKTSAHATTYLKAAETKLRKLIKPIGRTVRV